MNEGKTNKYAVAFYNLENLFDTEDDPLTNDDDFTPDGRKRWNKDRYHRKLKKLAEVISQIGTKETGGPPVILGVAEIENEKVLQDLVEMADLKPYDYNIVHFDSNDERGIEVALLYRKAHFELIHAEIHAVLLLNEEGEQDYTRDILHVKGRLGGEVVHFLVNHWPSRRDGTQETEYKRIMAAKRNYEIIEKISDGPNDKKIMILGDFNDNPNSPSILHHLVRDEYYNPFQSLFDKGMGTATHQKEWHLFDQIILSKNLVTEEEGLAYENAYIFNEEFLQTWKGKRKGSPFRTFIGKWHQGGYSDHFPVYVTLRD